MTHRKQVTVKAENGLHLRIATGIAKAAGSCDARLTLTSDGRRHADACSVLQMLMLEAQHGTSITIEADGREAELLIERVAALLEFEDGAGI